TSTPVEPSGRSHSVRLASAAESLSTRPAESVPVSQPTDELPRPGATSPPSPEAVLGEPAPAPPDSNVREVTMANILASVAGRNPEVAFASRRYAEAYARLIAAR